MLLLDNSNSKMSMVPSSQTLDPYLEENRSFSNQNEVSPTQEQTNNNNSNFPENTPSNFT
jgi:hypothetical protein